MPHSFFRASGQAGHCLDLVRTPRVRALPRCCLDFRDVIIVKYTAYKHAVVTASFRPGRACEGGGVWGRRKTQSAYCREHATVTKPLRHEPRRSWTGASYKPSTAVLWRALTMFHFRSSGAAQTVLGAMHMCRYVVCGPTSTLFPGVPWRTAAQVLAFETICVFLSCLVCDGRSPLSPAYLQ